MTMSGQTRPVVHPAIKPENPPERSSHYVDAPNMPWEGTKFPGIRIKVLYSYVIEGTLEDHEGVCGPGQFVWRPPGNQHEAVAPNGAVILGFFLKPNRFAYGEEFFTSAR
jgi:hypothetical protein